MFGVWGLSCDLFRRVDVLGSGLGFRIQDSGMRAHGAWFTRITFVRIKIKLGLDRVGVTWATFEKVQRRGADSGSGFRVLS